MWNRERIIAAIQERRHRGRPLTGVWRENLELYSAAQQLFGGWNTAVAATGVFRRPRKAWNRELVIDSIQYLYESGVPTQSMRKCNRGLSEAAKTYFGNWGNALAAAGIDAPPVRRWTKERVIAELQHHYRFGPVRLWRVAPQLADYASRLFGTIDQALEVAGLPSQPGRWTRRSVVSAIQDGYIRGLRLARSGFGNSGLAVASRRLFGSWRAAVQSAGLESRLPPPKPPPRRWSRAIVQATLEQYVCEGLNAFQIRQRDRRVYDAAKVYFGSWTSALAVVGVKPSTRQWSREAITQEIRRRHHEGLSLASTVVSHEDSGLLKAAHKHYGSWPKAKESAGVAPQWRRWDRDAIAEELRRRHHEGLSLSSRFIYRNVDSGFVAAAQRHFGNWRAAMQAAGLTTITRQWSRAAVSEEIRRRHRQRLSCSSSVVNREDSGLVRAALEYWGSWRLAMADAGLQASSHRAWSSQLVIAEIRRRHEEQRGMRYVDTYREDCGLVGAAARYFGTWHRALEAAGINIPSRERRARASSQAQPRQISRPRRRSRQLQGSTS